LFLTEIGFRLNSLLESDAYETFIAICFDGRIGSVCR